MDCKMSYIIYKSIREVIVMGREGFKAVNWWLPEELVEKLHEYRHYRRLATVTEAATDLLANGIARWEADPDQLPLIDKASWRFEAEEWRNALLLRLAEEAKERMEKRTGEEYVSRPVEGTPPFVSTLVRPKAARSHFDLRGVVDLRQTGLVEFRVEARLADMHADTERRQRAERDVDSLMAETMPKFESVPGQTQFKRVRILCEPKPFADLPSDDTIIKEFLRFMDSLDQCLAPVVRRYYKEGRTARPVRSHR